MYNRKQLIEQFVSSIDREIQTRKTQADQNPFVLHKGRILNRSATGMTYCFEGSVGSIYPETPGELKLESTGRDNNEYYNVLIMEVQTERVVLFFPSGQPPERIECAYLRPDVISLLQKMGDLVKEIELKKTEMDTRIADISFGIGSNKVASVQVERLSDSLNASQISAVKLAVGSENCFIWGPPGTGKSATLSTITRLLKERGFRILISAHTNEAVDGLMEKITECLNTKELDDGVAVRWRTTQSPKIAHITPSAIMDRRTDDLRQLLNEKRRESDGYKAKAEQCKLELTQGERVLSDLSIIEIQIKNGECEVQRIETQEVWLKKKIETNTNVISALEIKREKLRNCLPIFRLFLNKRLEALELSIENELTKTQQDRVRNNMLSRQRSKAEATLTNNRKRWKAIRNELIFASMSHPRVKELRLELESLQQRQGTINKEIVELERQMSRNAEEAQEILDSAQIVGATLTSSMMNFHNRPQTFDVVIVDEVSMAPCPSLYASLSLATKKAVQCGDFYQLSPIATDEHSEWLKNSIFDKTGITRSVSEGSSIGHLAILDTQYRSHSVIAGAIVNCVYRGALKNGRRDDDSFFYAQKLSPFPGLPCVLLDTSKLQNSRRPGCKRIEKSWVNEESAKLAMKLARVGVEAGIKSVGIITPYAKQAKHYQKAIRDLRGEFPIAKLEAATVHKYQGREMDMVIFDLVDCHPKPQLAPFLTGTHGSEAMRLINVATTRARGKLIVIANIDFIRSCLHKENEPENQILNQWLSYLKSNKSIVMQEMDYHVTPESEAKMTDEPTNI